MVLVSLFVPQCCLHSGHTKASTEKSKLLKKIVMISLLLREITRERRNKRDMLKIRKNCLIAAASSTINKFLSRLRVLKRD
jgi:hypothetical protein